MVWFGMVWFGLFWDNFHQDPTCFGCFKDDLQLVYQNPTCFDWFREDLKLVQIDKVWFGMVWFGMVWDNIHLKLLKKFHPNLTSFDWFREDLKFWVGWGGVEQQSSLAQKGLSNDSCWAFIVYGLYWTLLECFPNNSNKSFDNYK